MGRIEALLRPTFSAWGANGAHLSRNGLLGRENIVGVFVFSDLLNLFLLLHFLGITKMVDLG